MIQLLIVKSTEEQDNQLMLEGMATLVISMSHPVRFAGELDSIFPNTT